MIENLLNLSRLEAGVVELQKERVNVHKILQSVLQMLGPHAERKKQTLESDISPYLVPVVGDETYLSQVIEMVRKAQESRSRTQDLANRAAFWLTIIALSVPPPTQAALLL